MSNQDTVPTLPITEYPAGWYQHPGNPQPGVQMFWNGKGWDTHLVRHPDMPDAYAQPRNSHGPMTSSALNVNREVIYTRQQKGHSLTMHLLLGVMVLWVNVIYISVSPNHHWHI